MRARTPCSFVLAVTALLLSACVIVPRHEHQIAADQKGAPGIDRVFLAPMNAHVAFPDELKEGARRTHEQVQQYLSACDKTVSTMSLYRFRQNAQLAICAEDDW